MTITITQPRGGIDRRLDRQRPSALARLQGLVSQRLRGVSSEQLADLTPRVDQFAADLADALPSHDARFSISELQRSGGVIRLTLSFPPDDGRDTAALSGLALHHWAQNELAGRVKLNFNFKDTRFDSQDFITQQRGAGAPVNS